MKRKPSFMILEKGDAGRQDVFKKVDVDFDSKSSMDRASKLHNRYEKQGYACIETKQTGFNKFRNYYAKVGKKKMRSVS